MLLSSNPAMPFGGDIRISVVLRQVHFEGRATVPCRIRPKEWPTFASLGQKLRQPTLMQPFVACILHSVALVRASPLDIPCMQVGYCFPRACSIVGRLSRRFWPSLFSRQMKLLILTRASLGLPEPLSTGWGRGGRISPLSPFNFRNWWAEWGVQCRSRKLKEWILR